MKATQIDAICASAYNLHVGPKRGGESMTPAKAARLTRGDRAALCRILETKGGSMYSADECRKAFAAVVS